jgi:hypothetical protein
VKTSDAQCLATPADSTLVATFFSFVEEDEAKKKNRPRLCKWPFKSDRAIDISNRRWRMRYDSVFHHDL